MLITRLVIVNYCPVRKDLAGGVFQFENKFLNLTSPTLEL